MSDFALLSKVLDTYERAKINQEDITMECNTSCTHENTAIERGASVCTDCGQEIQKKITHDKEWKIYGQNRTHIRKADYRNIYKDVENLGFSEHIVSKANQIYAQVTQGKIYRGNSRRAIIFACIFHSYKLHQKPQSHEKLIKIFDLNRKDGLRGLKHVNLSAPKNSEIRTTYITPVNLVEEIMEQFSATNEQKHEVFNLYEKIKNKSSRLNRSRPQSVAASLVYYWIRLKKKSISLKDFTKTVTLSELTINKIAKEIEDVLGTPNII